MGPNAPGHTRSMRAWLARLVAHLRRLGFDPEYDRRRKDKLRQQADPPPFGPLGPGGF